MVLHMRERPPKEQYTFAQTRMHADRETRAHRNAHRVMSLKVSTGISLYEFLACVLVAEPRTGMIA